MGTQVRAKGLSPHARIRAERGVVHHLENVKYTIETNKKTYYTRCKKIVTRGERTSFAEPLTCLFCIVGMVQA